MVVVVMGACSGTSVPPAMERGGGAPSVVRSAAPVASAVSSSARPDDEVLPTADDFDEEARKEIHDGNYLEELDRLEREIEEDED